MRIRSWAFSVLIATPSVLIAQPARGLWTAGVAVVAPSQLLDAGDGDVATRVGVAIDVTREWGPRRDIRPAIRARVTSATTTATRGPNEWAPGALTVLDALAMLVYDVRPRVAIDVGAGASLVLAPADAAPFDALRGVRPVLDLGVRADVAPRWAVRVGAAVTPVADDAARRQTSGSFVRLSLGAHRAF